jgi:hypothetical protein
LALHWIIEETMEWGAEVVKARSRAPQKTVLNLEQEGVDLE